jgi:Tfp pilus assembly protein PilO
MEAAVKIENRQQFLVVLTVAALALLIGVNFVLTPLQNWWSARATQIKELRTRVNDGDHLIKREAALRDTWGQMLTNSLPANTSLAEAQLLRAVDDWSRNAGVEVTSLMPQWKDENTNYMTVDCHVETSGDIRALSDFIYDLEKGPMALRLDSIELGSHDNTGQRMTLGLEVNGLALLQNNAK